MTPSTARAFPPTQRSASPTRPSTIRVLTTLILLSVTACATTPAPTSTGAISQPQTHPSPPAVPAVPEVAPQPALPRSVFLPPAPLSPPAPSISTTSASIKSTPAVEQRITPDPPLTDLVRPLRVRGTPNTDLADIFFDFDSAFIKPASLATLQKNRTWLDQHPTATVTIEGHCDERGSSEYNLGLGQRRAEAIADYLIKAGVARTRISIYSYGKELPFAIAHDESAWQLNRRAHFRLTHGSGIASTP